MRLTNRIAGKARLSELFVWDGVLLGLVVALYVADRALPARAAAPVGPGAQATPAGGRPPLAATPTPPKPPAEPARPLRGPRRAGGGADELQAAGKAARAHLAAGRFDEALAALDDLPAALRGTPEEKALRGELEGELRRRCEALVALPRLQARIDRGELSGLETELSALPEGAERDQLRQDLDLARKRPRPAASGGGGFQVSEFRPGWGATAGQRVTLESGLPPDEARAVVEALDAVAWLAGELRGERPAPLKLAVLEPDGAPQPGLVTWRRAGEPREALVARARWVVALHLTDPWRLGGAPRWIGEGLPAALATAGATGGARPAQTAAGRALRRLFLARPPRGDGSEVTTLLGGATERVDPVRAWALAVFAASSDPAAQPARQALEGALRAGQAGGPPSLSPDRATALEGAWQAFLERP